MSVQPQQPTPGAGGPDSATLAGIQHQQQQAQGGKTGAHNLLFTGSPLLNISPTTQKAFWDGAIPGYKTSPFFKPGGGLNSRAKPLDMKKSGYAPPPGNAQHVNGQGALFGVQDNSQGPLAAIMNNSQGALAGVQSSSQGALAGVQHAGESKSNAGAMQAAMAQNTTQSALAAVQHQAKHVAQMGIGMNMQPFSGMDPLRQQNIFQSHLYSRMSPHDYMNYMPLNPFIASPSYTSSATQHHNQIIAAQQAAMQNQGKGRA